MANYLHDLCEALRSALGLRDWITLNCEADRAEMARDRAVSIGLIVNELVTNAVKHAFTGRETGAITVQFLVVTGGWRLVVADDGIGIGDPKPAPGASGGLGSRLIGAFARQAGGTIEVDSDARGTRATLELAG